MKTLILLFTSIFCLGAYGQTVSKKPIYNGSQSLSITELEDGRIFFSFQDSEYSAIVAIVSFSVSSKSKAIELIDKAIFILAMDKTDNDQQINDQFERVELRRYGFNQKVIYLSDNRKKSLKLNLKELQKIKLALDGYSYSFPSNQ